MNESGSQRYPQSLLVACLLPWTPDWRLDEQRFAQHIDETMDLGFKSLYILGTAGEGYALSEPLYQQVVTVFAQQTLDRDCDPQIGIISTSVGQIIDRIHFAHELGFRMFQLSLPCWGALSEEETLLFFKTVCGEFADSRFLHYNLRRT
jgi:dihydrodipicolinate synthase/N-acetylneuraminate lyase